MASFGTQLSFFLVLVLVLLLFLSPQIQAREGKFFSFFTHFTTTNNAKHPQVFLIKKPKVESPTTAPAPAPAPTPDLAPESTITSGPAAPEPEPVFVDRGNGYGLYGSGSAQYFSPTKETPNTFENKLLNEDFTGESYKTSYPKTNLHTNYNNEVYRKNNNNYYYNNEEEEEEYRSNYNGNGNGNGYTNNYANSYSKNYNYNGNEYNNYNGNGYEKKQEGMSDTRFLENGKYYYHVNKENENYNLNGYESGRGSTTTENKGYYGKNSFPKYEFDTMEQYEKQQESQGYTP